MDANAKKVDRAASNKAMNETLAVLSELSIVEESKDLSNVSHTESKSSMTCSVFSDC
jgi:hypothetical protein